MIASSTFVNWTRVLSSKHQTRLKETFFSLRIPLWSTELEKKQYSVVLSVLLTTLGKPLNFSRACFSKTIKIDHPNNFYYVFLVLCQFFPKSQFSFFSCLEDKLKQSKNMHERFLPFQRPRHFNRYTSLNVVPHLSWV